MTVAWLRWTWRASWTELNTAGKVGLAAFAGVHNRRTIFGTIGDGLFGVGNVPCEAGEALTDHFGVFRLRVTAMLLCFSSQVSIQVGDGAGLGGGEGGRRRQLRGSRYVR